MNEDSCRCPGCGTCNASDTVGLLARRAKRLRQAYQRGDADMDELIGFVAWVESFGQATARGEK